MQLRAILFSLLLGSILAQATEIDPVVAKQLEQLNAEVVAAFNHGNHEQRIEAAQRALEYAEQHMDTDDPHVASAMSNLGLCYKKKYDYTRAEDLYKRSLTIYEKPQNVEYKYYLAIASYNLASLYDDMGKYEQAEPLYQRALLIEENILDADDLDLASVLNNLGWIYKEKGDFNRAEPLLKRALVIKKKKLGSAHPDVTTPLNNLAELYLGMGKFGLAQRLFQQSLAIRKKADPESPNVALALNNLAMLYKEMHHYSRAEPLYKRALAIWELALGSEDPDVASVLNNLAELNLIKGKYEPAKQLFQKALAIKENVLGHEHPDVALTLSNLAALHWAMGDNKQAITLGTRANAIEEHNLSLILSTGSEAQKRAYIAMLAGSMHFNLSLHLKAAKENPEAARLALIMLLQRKGRVLDALTEGLGTIRDHLTPDDRALMDQLIAVRTQWANRVNKGPGSMEPAQYRTQLTELETEADRLESQISSRSTEYRAIRQPITVRRVQQALPQGSALVELAIYRPFNPKAGRPEKKWGPERYVAYVLFPNGEPRWAELGEAKAINNAVDTLRGVIRNPNSKPPSFGIRGQVIDFSIETKQVDNPFRTLDEQVLRPIRKLLGDTRTVFFSADGALNLIPLGALMDKNGHYLIENYHITYLTSGRDLLRMQVQHDAKGHALVLAAPDFGETGRNSPKLDVVDRGRRSADVTRGQLQFGPLPGTAQEARGIAPLLGIKAVTGDKASESELKQVHQPKVLHIATHGFFLPDQSEKDSLSFGSDRARPIPKTENPLLRSGLALTGANQLQSGTEDGLLTALEASSLDLWGTQLVVLSACETGVGAVRNGEGVYGLRRALVNAGAETQVMSLWKVDDAATRDLMVDYYTRLKTGEGRSEALRQAQLAMLHSKDRSHPYYWASFIVSGDWRGIKEQVATNISGSSHIGRTTWAATY